MPETDIIASIMRRASKQPANPLLVHGIGDDCAILRPVPGEDLVFTTDFMIEDRHFTRETHKPDDVGHKALARSLSDLAAMGATPLFFLVSLAVPSDLGEPWIRSFYTGTLGLAKRYGATLAGGDLASAEKIAVDVMCCGSVPQGEAMLRSAAKPGDIVCLTGFLGGVAQALREGRSSANWKRLVRPEPCIEQGIALRKAGVKACMDLSDGLSLDLHRLCLASGVSADLSFVPQTYAATLEDALNGGDDYELLFTVPPTLKPEGLCMLPIGIIREGKPGTVRFGGKIVKPAGYQHFR